MIKPDAYSNIGKIISEVNRSGFLISRLKMSRFGAAQAGVFYGEHKGKPFFPTLMEFITSDVVVGMELVAENAVKQWRELLGPTNSTVAKSDAPNSLRGRFGTDGTRNAAHGSDSGTSTKILTPAGQSAKRELGFFFSEDSPMKTSALLNECTCCIIKPHAVKDGYAGAIIDRILEEGFEISAMEMFYLDKPTAEEFFEVYKGVLPEFVPIVEHMTTGACIVLEVRQEKAVESFRELIGPHDPEIAKVLRPSTLRAQFGLDRVRNAVHCTDLKEDGALECEYFFSIMQGK